MPTSDELSDALKYCSCGAVEMPPLAYELNTTWSARKSVGFSHASTPFEKVSTVTPISGISRRDFTVPGAGALTISALPSI